MEGRLQTKKNTPRPNPWRTASRLSGASGLGRVRGHLDAKPSSVRSKNRLC